MYLEELLPEFRKGAKIRRKCWKYGAYIEKCAQGVIYYNIEEHELEILADDYEFYQEPIDWDYIIKNKCLCKFWDDDEFSIISFLVGKDSSVVKYPEYKYKEMNGRWWKNCRPVRRDEVTFYEERKDE